MVKALAALVLSIAAAPLARPADGHRGMLPEDYFATVAVSDPQLSPDGKRVAYTVTIVEVAKNRRQSAIWMALADGSRAPWPFTGGAASASSPRWSPDGRFLAFLSSRPTGDESTSDAPRAQVHLLPMDGGEARRVTSLKNGVSAYVWSPDGTRLALLSRTGPTDALPNVKDRTDARHYRHRIYKLNGPGWFDDKSAHVFVVDVAGGAAKQITDGDDTDDQDPRWSPDGKRIAFVSNRTGKAREGSDDTDVFVVGVDGGALTKVSDHAFTDRSPRWSPDGHTIAFVGEERDGEHPQIFLAPAAGGAPSTRAAKDLDLIPGNLEWGDGGHALYFDADARGESHLFRLDLASQHVAPVTSGPRAVRSTSRSEGARRMAYLVNDFTHPDEVYVADQDGKNERRLSRHNDALLGRLELAPVERVAYKGADGWEVDGFLVKPVGFEAGKKYPMVLSIHGGPAGMYGLNWYPEFHVYSARGWAVFFTNPRGSTGYGNRFQRGVKGEWGGKAYDDIMKGVEEVQRRNPWIDGERLGVTGGSYGGFMTNWIVSHTNVFKAAVTLRSISNFVSDEGTRDGAYGHATDFGGDLFENYNVYWDTSPLKYVANVKTPTLILHGENDQRVPIEQGEQWFRALRRFGVTAELVVFPRENHDQTRNGEPRHLVDSMRWQVYWFERYLNGNAGAQPPYDPPPGMAKQD
jgi:dipeptidyl aminopeptidase/acylaminoacyl peptidase